MITPAANESANPRALSHQLLRAATRIFCVSTMVCLRRQTRSLPSAPRRSTRRETAQLLEDLFRQAWQAMPALDLAAQIAPQRRPLFGALRQQLVQLGGQVRGVVDAEKQL